MEHYQGYRPPALANKIITFTRNFWYKNEIQELPFRAYEIHLAAFYIHRED